MAYLVPGQIYANNVIKLIQSISGFSTQSGVLIDSPRGIN
jgi:hypothetical protein